MIDCIERRYAPHSRTLPTVPGPHSRPSAQLVPWAEVHPERTNADAAAAEARTGLRAHRIPPPDGLSTERMALPYVQAGEWRVACPYCGEAQLAALSDPRMVCTRPVCRGGGPSGANGRAIAVALREPLEMMQIELFLLMRPEPGTRGLDPGEQPSELDAQNCARGIEPTAELVHATLRYAMPYWLEIYGEAAQAAEQALLALLGPGAAGPPDDHRSE